MSRMPRKGEYTLGTRWGDGDPKDPWMIGFYDGTADNRVGHYVRDSAGNRFLARRVKKISKERGEWLLKNRAKIDDGHRSVWAWAKLSMKEKVIIPIGYVDVAYFQDERVFSFDVSPDMRVPSGKHRLAIVYFKDEETTNG